MADKNIEENDGYISEEDEDYKPENSQSCGESEEDDHKFVDDDGEAISTKKTRKSKKSKLSERAEVPIPQESKDDDYSDDFLDSILGVVSTSSSVPVPVVTSTVLQPIKTYTSAVNKITPTAVAESPVTITEIYDFAGEQVTVNKEISQEELAKRDAKKQPEKRPVVKRTGLGNALTLLSKKPKMTVLDKTSLDWNSFKEENQITEELSTHNKGRDGYLNKVEFLQRTDLREFEKEKNIRATQRK